MTPFRPLPRAPAAAVAGFPHRSAARPTWRQRLQALLTGEGVRPPDFDVVLLGAVLALSALGLVLVYSSSALLPTKDGLPGPAIAFRHLRSQFIAWTLGLGSMVFLMRRDDRSWKRWANSLFLGAIAVCALAFVDVLNGGQNDRGINGAQRWINLGVLRFQPSEFLRAVTCVWLAGLGAEFAQRRPNIWIGLGHLCLLGGALGMLLGQKDGGSFVILAALVSVVLVTAWTWIPKPLIFGLPVLLVGVVAALLFDPDAPYRLERVRAYLDPFQPENYHGKGFQVAHGLIHVAQGGLLGSGLGLGPHKLILPECHTDYIVVSAGAELGVLGIAVVLGLTMVIVWRGMRIATRAPDDWGRTLAFSITVLLAAESAANALMALGLLPPKGVAYPLMSYGGTALLRQLTLLGFLLSVSRRTRPEPVPARIDRHRTPAVLRPTLDDGPPTEPMPPSEPVSSASGPLPGPRPEWRPV